MEIQVRREYEPVPPLRVDRHKLLQILINLLSNARHALLESHRLDKQLTLRISRQPEERLRLEVSDNGVGIAPEHLARYIAHKGSVALDGVSLTVNEVQGRRFGVNLIPHTAAVTTFGQLALGQSLNLEVDQMARLVERLLGR